MLILTFSGLQCVFKQTHEEVVTNLFSSDPITYKHLPLMLYQIGSKFRDEIRPKLGIIRSKEFLMKDLYSFDRDQASAAVTYDLVGAAYEKIFKRIGVTYLRGRINFIKVLKP